VETGRCHRVALLWLGGGGKEFVAVSGMEEKRRSGDSLDAVASRSIVTYRMMKGRQAIRDVARALLRSQRLFRPFRLIVSSQNALLAPPFIARLKKGDLVALNFLEQLVAEWYEFRGYFVRRKIHVGPRLEGKFDFELDIVAFHPGKPHLVHIEPSMDATSWDQREKRYTAKFGAGRKLIPSLFSGFDLPEIDQIALLVLLAD
jgi:hypothetical protein